MLFIFFVLISLFSLFFIFHFFFFGAGTDAAGEALLVTLVGPDRIGSLTLDSFITRYLSVLFGIL